MTDLFGNDIKEKSQGGLDRKIEFAINLIRAASAKAKEFGQVVEVCYSGGKDSDVILELTKMAGVPYRAIYKNTTIDPPGTPAQARKAGCEIVMPKMNFISLMEKKGFPSRTARFCCEVLKEYKINDYAILGIRKDESKKRDETYQEPELCREYNKTDKTRQYFPILYWSKEDVAEFIRQRNIQCHPLYYDEQGKFHPERRLGCMCCPQASTKQRIIQFKKHPQMVKLYIRAGRKFAETHDLTKRERPFNDVYEWFCMSVFCSSYQEFQERFGNSLYGNTDCKKFLENYFKIAL